MSKLFPVIILFIAACSTVLPHDELTKFPLEYINIWRNGNAIDTLYKQMNSIEYIDSVYYLNYTEINFNGDTTQYEYELPISNSKRILNQLKNTSEYRLKYEGLKSLKYDKNYIVYKYEFDDTKSDDEEMNYYFIPEFGIVIIKSRAWGTYSRLVSTSKPTDINTVFYLTERIVNDFDGFRIPANN